MLTLLYGLHCTLDLLHFNLIFVILAHLHAFNTCYYRISSNKRLGLFFQNQSWTKGEIEGKSRGNTAGENIAILNHFVIYKLSIYKNN